MQARSCLDSCPKHPIQDRHSDARREPFALGGWILEIIYFDPKGGKALCRSFLRRDKVFAYVGRIQTLMDLKD